MAEHSHVLLIPFDVDPKATTRAHLELNDALTKALPPWVRPVLLPGARGSAVLLPMSEPGEAPPPPFDRTIESSIDEATD